MEETTDLDIVIIGDSRAKGYGCNLHKYFNVLACDEHSSLKHSNIMDHVESRLEKVRPDCLLIITFFEDIILRTEKKTVDANKNFSAHDAIESIKYYSTRLTSKFPYLNIIWTLPDVPDLVEYNNMQNAYSSHIQNLRKEEIKIFKSLQEVKNKFYSTVYQKRVDLFNLRSLIIDDDVELKLLPYLSAHSHKPNAYVDGVHPVKDIFHQLGLNKTLSELLGEQLSKTLKSDNFSFASKNKVEEMESIIAK